jgi:uncharacterized protein (TIGR02996 family)
MGRLAMHNENALFRAILDEPDNETLRLIYADLCEEKGDPRGDFIRVQCQLAHLPADHPDRPPLEQREWLMFHQHKRRWNGPLHRMLSQTPLRHRVKARRGLVRGWGYRRGFVELVMAEAQAFLKHADILFQLGPVQHVQLWRAQGLIPQLAASPHLGRLNTLDLGHGSLTGSDVQDLARFPHLQGLTRDTPSRPTLLTRPVRQPGVKNG